eukprot:4320479-Alexandrium_andersonii.AAC.1
MPDASRLHAHAPYVGTTGRSRHRGRRQPVRSPGGFLVTALSRHRARRLPAALEASGTLQEWG